MTAPRWAEIMAEAIRVDRESFHTALPGRVKSYNATKKTATIEIQTRYRVRVRGGSAKQKAFPLLPNVPVGQPAAGGYFVHLPVTAGSFVWVLFSERSLETVKSKAGVSDQDDERLHHLSYGFALPVYDVSAPLSDAVADALVLGKAGGPHLVIDANGVKLGAAGAGEAIPKGSTQKTELEKILTVVSAIHTVVTGSPIPEPGSGAASAFQTALSTAISALTLPSNLNSTVSTKHKLDS